MGIKGFSKTFDPKIITPKNLKGLTLAIDASVLLYKASLGGPSVKTLTDESGNPTLHIAVIMAKALNFEKVGAGQIWVFDYHEKGYSPPDKEFELVKRKTRRDAAVKKLSALKKEKDDMFSSDDEDETPEQSADLKKTDLDKKINNIEKQCFSMSDTIINDCKFILDCLGITWCVSPKGVEAEHLCAALTNDDDVGCDAVFSTDADALLYGAQQLIREVKVKTKKVLQIYSLDDILNDAEIDMEDLTKIGIILGTDHSPKTPGVGPKTVLKKFKNIDLTEEQEKVKAVFKKTVDISKVKFSNEFGMDEICQDEEKINKLIDWLLSVKNFNRDRVKKQIGAVYDGKL
jgi:hypothetical protein